MRLRLNFVYIDINTDKGRFGRKQKFGPGLNIVRAKNWAGKSTLFQSVLFALGLEGMLSASHVIPLPHVMTEYIEVGSGEEAKVLDSNILIEIENELGERMTITRGVVGRRDPKLVRVQPGFAYTEPSSSGRAEDLFVRTAGAATSDKGFHTRLAVFVGWDLPHVPKFEGGDAPLYVETLFPLLFVEQKLGWGRLPGRFPTWLGIRDVRRRAIEYLLGLDAFRLANERNALLVEANRIRTQWTSARTSAIRAASAQGAIVQNLPTEPLTAWPPLEKPNVYLEGERGWQPVRVRISNLKESLAERKAKAVPTAGESLNEATARLTVLEDAVTQQENSLRRLIEQLEADSSELHALDRRVAAVRDDQRKYRDVAKLQRLGSEDKIEAIEGICPTCHQSLVDSLVDLGKRATPMSVEQNISFYDEQIALFSAAAESLRSGKNALEAQVNSARRQIEDGRLQIRSLKETLTSVSSIPSVAEITERITSEQKIVLLETLASNFSATLDRLSGLSEEWRDIEERRRNLPKGALSEDDEAKLALLDESFHRQLRKYGFGSVEASKIVISRSDYEPQLEDMNLADDAAASDVIRLQWAYLLGLIDVANRNKTNHPKFLMLDEPQQQSVSSEDFFAMLSYASSFSDSQVIIATSHEAQTVAESVRSNENTSLLEFGEQRMIERL